MQRQTTGPGAQRPLPGTPISRVCTIGLPAAVAPDLAADCRWRPSEAPGKLPDRPAHRNATGNLFAFLKPECCQGSPPRRRPDPSMEYHDPLNAGLVLPFQRPRDGRGTLPVLPSLPQLGFLRCREPNPRRHHGTPPHLVRLEGVALIGDFGEFVFDLFPTPHDPMWESYEWRKCSRKMM